jgi:hypothetical protein
MVPKEPVLGMHHVADREPGKLHARLGLAVRGGGTQSVADGIDAHDVVLGGVERFSRTNQEIDPVVP